MLGVVSVISTLLLLVLTVQGLAFLKQRKHANTAKHNLSCLGRWEAVKRVTNQSLLSDLAKNAEDDEVRRRAVERMTNHSLLADFARNDKSDNVRAEAVKRVTDQTLLADIARNDKSDNVRAWAVKFMTDQTLLASIVPDNRFYQATIRLPVDLALVRDLLSKGARVDSRGYRQGEDVTPLYGAVEGGHMELAQLLIDNGADVHFTRKEGTALHRAAARGHVALATLLLDHGADVNARNSRGGIPLHDAALNSNAAMVTLLISRGAEVNAADEYGYTPLHESARAGKADVVAVLLSHNADAKAMVGNQTPLGVAKAEDHADVVALLEAADPAAAAKQAALDIADTTDLTRAIVANDLTVIENRIDSGADVNALHKRRPAIICAVNVEGNNALKVVEWLVHKGARVNAVDEVGRTALDWAASGGKLSLVRLLVENGAAVNQPNGLGMTPLQGAKMQGYSEIVQFLRSHGGY
jgi:ankyrin repeat protein